MANRDITLAAIGCSSEVGEIFVEGFLKRGIKLRILARNPEDILKHHPAADVIKGSMMKPADVTGVMEGADAAFVITPMSPRNGISLEVAAMKSVIAGAQKAKLEHFIYTSVLGADKLRGVGILDAKVETERLLKQSGLPYSILRCGTYMEDVFDPRLELLNKGKFLFPVTKDRRFTYTCQRDVPRFAVDELLAKDRILNRPINFVSSGTYALREVEALLSKTSGIQIKAPNKFPTFYLFRALLPIFNLSGHRFSSVVPLIQYFDKHGYVDGEIAVGDLFPEFHMTTLAEHFQNLWPEREH